MKLATGVLMFLTLSFKIYSNIVYELFRIHPLHLEQK